MRIAALAATALLASAPLAMAAPTSVSVTVGPALREKAAKTYGVRDIDELAARLRTDVVRTLAKTGAYDGARIELVLADAVPNRPTFKQMGDKPGLSMDSFGVGGARIEGQAIAADGATTPLRYSHYETDIREAQGRATWTDAERTISQFARRLGRGETLASR